ncbi:polyphosphate polymerase domain-containing protein [Anaerovorax odorimutans]|uniref:Polyphosphate polymerase domain-containing protein n=1 Tax=Anaerovorax odorimutans TaxID=109327 RepID=A0ABT1RPZ4_9FIRM|nr:polyphosphate polymerase domain-containing protein [Anaerovorax odorimutans]MCQ4637263.1 polyphosphate polymerase domain-containing protein [Anaerovorax odorimutans]
MEQVFRKEIKYRISVIQYARLAQLLDKEMKRDAYSSKYGSYKVRSLYFDSIHNQDLRDVLAGNYAKRKIRLRVYSPKDKTAKLELKVKHGPDQQKFSLNVSREQAKQLAQGNFNFLRNMEEEVAAYIYQEMTLGVYRPQVIIEYDRTAFIHETNRIRITFDQKVRGSDSNLNLFSENLNLYPLMPEDTGVLEVKYDGFLMSYIKDALALIDQLPQSNSKYVLGRLKTY